MAIQRQIRIEYRTIQEALVRANSQDYGSVEISFADELKADAAGSWTNYITAAISAVLGRWNLAHGIEAKVTSDLPAAAGLSSSSALMTGFAIAIARANRIEPTLEEWMKILPEAEQFVGTRGGGMDHAIALAGSPGCALLVDFVPLTLTAVPIPDSWSFVVAHSLRNAEKSGAVREQFNSRRTAGRRAFEKLRFGEPLTDEEARSHRHVVSEGHRVKQAVDAMECLDKEAFGKLLSASHTSLRDDLRVSCAELDELVDLAMKNKALGARLTGAGFGGCAIVFCEIAERARIAQSLVDGFYAKRKGFICHQHLIFAEPSAGALHA
jgi:galactokinase